MARKPADLSGALGDAQGRNGRMGTERFNVDRAVVSMMSFYRRTLTPETRGETAA